MEEIRKIKKSNCVSKEDWQSGKFRVYPEFATQEGYYKEVKKFIEVYGEPTKRDMLLVRSGEPEEEQNKNYGASWTTNINVCRRNAKRALATRIYITFVPKGTKAVYLPAKGIFEEEYVLDMEGKADKVDKIAKFNGYYDVMTSDYETKEDFDKWEFVKSNIVLAAYMWDKKVYNRLFE